MESQIQATVLGVMGRTSRDGQHQMYDVQLSDGNKYTTFDPELATKANGFLNQQVAANVKVEQKPGRNGRTFTNFDLVDIGPIGQVQAPAAGGVPLAAPLNSIPQQAAAPGIPQQAIPSQMDDQARMGRYAALKVAFPFVSQLFAGAGPEALGEALGLARQLTEGLLQYGTTGKWPGNVEVTPAAIAAGVPGVQVGVEGVQQEAPAAEPTQAAATQGSDIPWD